MSIDNYGKVFDLKENEFSGFLSDSRITDIDEEDIIKLTDEVETLAGLILELKGEIPAKGDKVTHGRYQFEVTAVDKRRIQKVKLHIKTDEEIKNEEAAK